MTKNNTMQAASSVACPAVTAALPYLPATQFTHAPDSADVAARAYLPAPQGVQPLVVPLGEGLDSPLAHACTRPKCQRLQVVKSSSTGRLSGLLGMALCIFTIDKKQYRASRVFGFKADFRSGKGFTVLASHTVHTCSDNRGCSSTSILALNAS